MDRRIRYLILLFNGYGYETATSSPFFRTRGKPATVPECWKN